jgi:hypothetical protein
MGASLSRDGVCPWFFADSFLPDTFLPDTEQIAIDQLNLSIAFSFCFRDP